MCEHKVHFYDDDAQLVRLVTGFLAQGLAKGEACIVVATEAHRSGVERRLRQTDSHRMDEAIAAGRYVAFDAAATLQQFTRDGRSDEQRFVETLGPVIDHSGHHGARAVRIFGEMVALLHAELSIEEAVLLEKLWNRLGVARKFSLLCAYPMTPFGKEEEGVSSLLRICAEHSEVKLPADWWKSEDFRSAPWLIQAVDNSSN